MSKLTVGFLFCLTLWSSFTRNYAAKFKVGKSHCETFDKSLALINSCSSIPCENDSTRLDVNITLLKEFNVIDITCEWKRRSNKALLYNKTHDFCSFMKKKNVPFLNLFFSMFQEYSNINHPCPYSGDQIVDGVYPKDNMLYNVPVPMGAYSVTLTWHMNKSKLFMTYFEGEYA